MKSRRDFINSLNAVPAPEALKELVSEKDASNAEAIYNGIARSMRENPGMFSSENSVDVSAYFHTPKEEVFRLVSEAFAKYGWSLVVEEDHYFIKAV
ncbi:MAG: hypothetical protein KME45_22005 [Stenomitos rutilans HA7619-LM2]|nr:hypothetical protein [Stenomitos rutilans HA7619-LM2]